MVALFGLVRVTVHQAPKYLIWSPTLMVSLLWSVAAPVATYSARTSCQ